MSTKPIMKIAFADDQPIVREGIRSTIARHNYLSIIIEAKNGRELLDAIERAPELPDVCILDINMPVMNGFDTIEELKRRWPEMGVLVFTVFKNEWQLMRMMYYGANGYLLKSSGTDELCRAIVAVANNGLYYTDSEAMFLLKAIRNNQKPLPRITPKEMELLTHSCSELTYQEIAEKLNTSLPSIDGFRASLFKKLKISSRVGMVLFAVQFGLVSLNTSDGPIAQ
jgi:two-component system, NarL family, invasion response regulator UvrY